MAMAMVMVMVMIGLLWSCWRDVLASHVGCSWLQSGDGDGDEQARGSCKRHLTRERTRWAVGWQLHRRAVRTEAAGATSHARRRAGRVHVAARWAKIATPRVLRTRVRACGTQLCGCRAERTEAALWTRRAIAHAASIGRTREGTDRTRKRRARTLRAVRAHLACDARGRVRLGLSRARSTRLARIHPR